MINYANQPFFNHLRDIFRNNAYINLMDVYQEKWGTRLQLEACWGGITCCWSLSRKCLGDGIFAYISGYQLVIIWLTWLTTSYYQVWVFFSFENSFQAAVFMGLHFLLFINLWEMFGWYGEHIFRWQVEANRPLSRWCPSLWYTSLLVHDPFWETRKFWIRACLQFGIFHIGEPSSNCCIAWWLLVEWT